MLAAAVILGTVLLALCLVASLVVLVMVACTSSDPREVGTAVRALMGVLLMLGALVAGVAQASRACDRVQAANHSEFA